MKIILASASPRRSQLLNQVGLAFTIQPSEVVEKYTEGQNPKEWVQEIALEKALDVAKDLNEGIIIGADTIVIKDGYILGKPNNDDEAIKMLSFLSGQEHLVLTGVALVDAKNKKNHTTLVEKTKVKFRQLGEAEIKSYVATGEPLDKAGSYGIQGKGALFVESIEGCFFNVVGLPLNKLAQELQKFGVEVIDGNESSI